MVSKIEKRCLVRKGLTTNAALCMLQTKDPQRQKAKIGYMKEMNEMKEENMPPKSHLTTNI